MSEKTYRYLLVFCFGFLLAATIASWFLNSKDFRFGIWVARECLFFFILIMEGLKLAGNLRNIFSFLLPLSLIGFVLGKMHFFPGIWIFLLSLFVMICLLFAGMFIRKQNKNTFLWIFIFTEFFSILFSIMHFPGKSVIALIQIPLTVAIIIYLLIQLNKKENSTEKIE